MKKFLVKVFLFLLSASALIFYTFSAADGYTDAFYLRLTTPKQSSLILGTSRAAQGLHPQTLNEQLNRTDLYNYSFTIGHSPYGPVYLNSIQEKLAPGTKDGVFILTVDPWSISSNMDQPNDTAKFRELRLCLHTTRVVNMSPNVFYLLNSFDQPFINIYRNKRKPSVFLHDDGWLEVNVAMDSASLNSRIKAKMIDYKSNFVPVFNYSSVRLEYLIKTIEFLKSSGKVYLVRMPVHQEMVAIEESVIPQFDALMQQVSQEQQVPYLDLTLKHADYQYIDGNHLHKESAKRASEEIAKWITGQP